MTEEISESNSNCFSIYMVFPFHNVKGQCILSCHDKWGSCFHKNIAVILNPRTDNLFNLFFDQCHFVDYPPPPPFDMEKFLSWLETYVP